MGEETADRAPARAMEDKAVPEREIRARQKWTNNTEFILAMAGEIIGLGNVWRFPYLCYRNGGGVFFIPYFVFLFFCGVPVFFLETALGQYTSEGGVTAWRKICPMFEGIGIACQVIVTYFNIYYIVVLAWGIFYLFNSFQSPLPWSTCDNWWNSKQCHSSSSKSNISSDWSFLLNNSMDEYAYDINVTSFEQTLGTSAEQEFWK